jgi:hypothetical protein
VDEVNVLSDGVEHRAHLVNARFNAYAVSIRHLTRPRDWRTLGQFDEFSDCLVRGTAMRQVALWVLGLVIAFAS